MSLIPNNGSHGALPLIMVVEYLESSMSRDLLGKFPDNSAFDFDYSQSCIWSPLVPRPVSSVLSDGRDLELSKILSFINDGDDYHLGLLGNTKKLAANIKRKFTDAVFDHIHKYHKMKKRNRRKSFDFSPVPSSHRLASSSPTPKKAWAKVMKAAGKHFKKKSKKKDTAANVVQFDISNYLVDGKL